jgi:hypothetical protein
MTTLYKKAVIKFTAYKEFDCPQDKSLEDSLKLFCEDNDIDYSCVVLLDMRDECPMCGKFVSKVIECETKYGVELEGCQDCIDNWEEEDHDEDSNSDR